MDKLMHDRELIRKLGSAARASIGNHTDEKLFESFTQHIAELV
jgi:hypothetical protein